MNHRDERIGTLLDRLPVPDHRPGFWNEVGDGLQRDQDVEPLSALPVRRRPPWMTAIISAAAVMATLLVVPIVSSDDPVRLDEPAPVTTDTTPPSTATNGLTATTRTSAPSAGAPWSNASLAAADTPEVVLETWNRSSSRHWCSALAPVGVADVRALDGTDYAIAWQTADGTTHSVRGVGLIADGLLERPGYEEVVLEDGSRWIAYPEGLDPSATRWLADVQIPGQACLYQVTAPDETGVRDTIESLRFVEGAATVVTLRTADDVVRTDGGTAPWAGEPVSDSELESIVEADRTVPLLTITDADPSWSIRRAAVGDWGIAWDAPAGPGHDGLNQPCTDCGRGVAGLGALGPSTGPPSAADIPLEIITWADGSRASITYRILDSRLPIDVATMSSAGGGLAPDGLRADLTIGGFEYQVWTHLGIEHLRELLGGIRLVES